MTTKFITILALAIATGLATTKEARAEGSADHTKSAALWDGLGCSGCHGENGFYRDKIKGALGKPVADVARWIRNAPSIKPGTPMPNFENVIDVKESEALADWVLQRAATLR